MTRLLLTIVAVLLVSHQAIADDGIKWSQPANGLRIGIESPATSITSDQDPICTVTFHGKSTNNRIAFLRSSDRVGQIVTRRAQMGSCKPCVPPCVP